MSTKGYIKVICTIAVVSSSASVWGFVHLILCRAAGQQWDQMWKAMTYEVRQARSKKNMSKPSWCATCGPFAQPFAMGTARSVERADFQMCSQALCKVRSLHSGGRRWLSAPLIEKFKCWFSLTTLGICLFTLWRPSPYSFLLFTSLDNCDFAVCSMLSSSFSNRPPDNKQCP